MNFRNDFIFKGLCAISVLLAALISSCDERPKVTIEGGNIPSFRLTGRGTIGVISVDGPDPTDHREPGSRAMKPYWVIAPVGDQDIQALERAGGLMYGKVPNGFRQIFPEGGVTASPLPENELLAFGLRTQNGAAIGVRFVIHNGKAVMEGS